jgi:hypothetical protein
MQEAVKEPCTLSEDPELEEVQVEDRPLVKDVIAVLSAMQHPNTVIRGWVVTIPKATRFYEVLGSLDLKAGECEVTLEDMELLKQLDLYRVAPSLRITAAAAHLVVRVTRRSERVMVSEHSIVRVQKRARWWW